MQDALRFVLMDLLVPLWIAAGFVDWALHRRTAIAATSGLTENAFHWAMYLQMALLLAGVVLFEPSAALLAIGFTLFVLHELTVYVELDYTTLRRDVGPLEQMVHSFLELLPFVLLVLVALAAWPQVLAIAGAGGARADWTLVPRELATLRPWLIAAGAGTLLFNVLPLLQETVSCAWARRGAKARARQQAADSAEAAKIEPSL